MSEEDALEGFIDPDIAFALVINQCVPPEVLYDYEVRVSQLFPGVWQLETDGSEHQLAEGMAYIMETLELDDNDESLLVWESTELNPNRFVTTIVQGE